MRTTLRRTGSGHAGIHLKIPIRKQFDGNYGPNNGRLVVFLQSLKHTVLQLFKTYYAAGFSLVSKYGFSVQPARKHAMHNCCIRLEFNCFFYSLTAYSLKERMAFDLWTQLLSKKQKLSVIWSASLSDVEPSNLCTELVMHLQMVEGSAPLACACWFI